MIDGLFTFNNLLFFVLVLVNWISILLCYRYFGKTGLFCWMAFGVLVANVGILKNAEIFWLMASLGNVTHITLCLIVDIINENYGYKEAKKAVYIGFTALILFTIIMQINLLFNPSMFDTGHEHMLALFKIMPWICAGSILGYLISNMIDVWIFSTIKKYLPDDKYLWIRKLGSTTISQAFDVVIFVIIGFSTFASMEYMIALMTSIYIFKVLINTFDTPFIYISKRIQKKLKENGIAID